MKIASNFVSKYNFNNVKAFKSSQTPEMSANSANSTNLINSNAISQINSNLPVSYSKVGEISIPGLNQKAHVFKLANGQKVVILSKKGPTFIKTTYNVGSLNEKDDIRGISHFIEHNMFNGSKDLAPKEYDARLSDMGGSTNASTSFDYTDYFLSLQLLDDKSLEEAIKLNANLTQYPIFQNDQLEKEKEPVKSEIDMCSDNPSSLAYSALLKNLFNIQSDSENFIIGTKDNINALTRDKVLDYFNTWYTPDNAVTVITGDVDVDETIKLVSKYYNKKNDYSKINQRQQEPLKYIDKTVRQDVIAKNSLSSSINLGFVIPEGTSQKELEDIDMLLKFLSSDNSRLTKKLDSYGAKLNTEYIKIQNKPNSAQALIMNLSVSENQIEDVLKILYDEITYISNNPPSFQDVELKKSKTIKAFNEISESSRDINSILTKVMLEGGNTNYFNDSINNILAITPLDISNAAKKFLDLNKTSIYVSHSKDANADDIQKNYNKSISKSISFGSSHNPMDNINDEINKIEQYRLPNNINTAIIPGEFGYKSLITADFNNEGLNNVPSPALDLLNMLLERGTAFKNIDTVSNINEQKSLYQSIFVSKKGISFSSGFYPENISEALSLLKENILYPNFSQEEFDRAKSILKDSILDEMPSADDKLYKDIFGNNYLNKDEKLKVLDSLTLQDIQNIYYSAIANSKVNISMIAPDDKKSIMKNIMHNEFSQNMPIFKPFSTNHDSSYYTYKPNTETKVYTESIENAQAYLSQYYIYQNSENVQDEAKIKLLTEILGGGMSSRLFLDLRENQKLAYHVNAINDSVNNTGLMKLYIETTTDSPNPNEGSPENVNKALEGFNKNVELLKSQNVSQKELDRAKASVKTSILNDLETNIDKESFFSSSVSSQYGLNYYKYLLEAIDNVTVDDIRAAANYVFKNPPLLSVNASKKTLDALNLSGK